MSRNHTSRNQTRSQRRQRYATGLLGTFLLLSTPVSLTAEVVGYSAQNDEIVELFLTQTGDRVPEGRRWSFPDIPRVQGLERDDNTGLLYAAAISGLNNAWLFELDLEAGTSNLLTFIGVFGSTNLAFDDQGLLWMSRSSGEILSYDLETDTLTVETTIASATPRDLAWWDGRLYVLLSPIGGVAPPTLAVLDPATGDLTDSRELTSLIGDDLFPYFVDSLDIDASGGMWISFISTPGIADPPLYFGNTAYFSDPIADSTPVIRQLEAEIWSSVPLTVAGLVTPVEVPTLGQVSLGLLVSLLALGGLWSLRRTSATGP